MFRHQYHTNPLQKNVLKILPLKLDRQLGMKPAYGSVICYGLKDLKDTAGLPSKKIMDNDIDYGSLEGYYKEDREFYNLLTDSIERFKMVVNKFPMNLHRMLMDVWIGRASYQELERRFIGEFNRAHNRQSEDDSTEGKLRVMMPQVSNSILIGSNLFHHLKNGSPKKYEKAVSEFFKAVQGSL